MFIVGRFPAIVKQPFALLHICYGGTGIPLTADAAKGATTIST